MAYPNNSQSSSQQPFTNVWGSNFHRRGLASGYSFGSRTENQFLSPSRSEDAPGGSRFGGGGALHGAYGSMGGDASFGSVHGRPSPTTPSAGMSFHGAHRQSSFASAGSHHSFSMLNQSPSGNADPQRRSSEYTPGAYGYPTPGPGDVRSSQNSIPGIPHPSTPQFQYPPASNSPGSSMYSSPANRRYTPENMTQPLWPQQQQQQQQPQQQPQQLVASPIASAWGSGAMSALNQANAATPQRVSWGEPVINTRLPTTSPSPPSAMTSTPPYIPTTSAFPTSSGIVAPHFPLSMGSLSTASSTSRTYAFQPPTSFAQAASAPYTSAPYASAFHPAAVSAASQHSAAPATSSSAAAAPTATAAPVGVASSTLPESVYPPKRNPFSRKSVAVIGVGIFYIPVVSAWPSPVLVRGHVEEFGEPWPSPQSQDGSTMDTSTLSDVSFMFGGARYLTAVGSPVDDQDEERTRFVYQHQRRNTADMENLRRSIDLKDASKRKYVAEELGRASLFHSVHDSGRKAKHNLILGDLDDVVPPLERQERLPLIPTAKDSPLHVALDNPTSLNLCTIAYGGAPADISKYLEDMKMKRSMKVSDVIGVVNAPGYVVHQRRFLGVKRNAESYGIGLGGKGTPLQFAAVAGKLDSVCFLLHNGAEDKMTPTLREIAVGNNFQALATVLDILEERKAQALRRRPRAPIDASGSSSRAPSSTDVDHISAIEPSTLDPKGLLSTVGHLLATEVVEASRN